MRTSKVDEVLGVLMSAVWWAGLVVVWVNDGSLFYYCIITFILSFGVMWLPLVCIFPAFLIFYPLERSERTNR